MNNNLEKAIRIILNILIVGLIVYVVARLFIFLLPIVIVLIVLYYLYKIYVETKGKIAKNKFSDKKDNIVDAEIIDEKINK